ncbi:hypothetical protein K502DRAFT_119230 [Neoconidiobolus thromboides FSU 785]|nr:hypothetical protein K502DRAFT_119230 [Neoconidiobolus thromboides FSU 785]
MLMHSFGFQTLPVRVFEYFPRLGEPGERITAQLEKCPELMNLNLKLAIGMKLLDTVQWLSARGYIQLSAILPKMEEIGWFDNKAPLYVVSVTFEGNMEIPIRNWCFGDFVYTTSINPSIPTNTNNVDACIVTNQSSVNISTGVTTDSISMMNSNEKFFDVANNFTNDNLTMSTNNDTVNIAHENLIINTTSYDYKVDHQPRNDLYQTYQPLFGYNNYNQILPMTYDLHSANPPQPRLRMGTYMNHLRSSLESTNYYPSQSEKEMLASQSLYDPFLSPAFSNSGFDPTLFTTINNSNIHANNIGTTIGGLNLVNNDSMLLYYKDRLFDNNVFDLVQSEQKMHAKYAEPTLMNGVNEMRTTPQEKTINKFSNVKEIKRRKSKSKEINNSRSPEDGVNQISGMNMTLAKTHYKSNQAKRSPGLVETNSCENQLSTTSEPNSTPSTLSPPSESNKPREKKLVPMGNGSKLKPKLNVKEDSSEPPNKRKKGEQKLELKLNKKIFSKKMNDLTSPNDDKKITFNTASFHGVLNRAELIFESDVKQFVESW